jgi:hypothetical protein
MLTTVTRVLRLAFVPSEVAAESSEEPLIEFVAYARDSVLAGLLHLAADRLTDLLNGSDELDLIDVLSMGFDGRIVESDRVAVRRSDLVAVKAGDPRGNATLRHRTRQVAMAVGAGPYLIHGYMHGRPGSDPLVHLGRRPPMIPLTDAAIGYHTTHGWQRDDASTLIVNRDTADWFRSARDDEPARFGREYGAA